MKGDGRELLLERQTMTRMHKQKIQSSFLKCHLQAVRIDNININKHKELLDYFNTQLGTFRKSTSVLSKAGDEKMAKKFVGKRSGDEEQSISFFTRQPKTSPDVEARLNRIKQHSGVLGVIVVNNEGIAVRSTLDNPTTQLYLQHCRQLIHLARHTIRDIDPRDDLKFFRVRSRKNELLIAPDEGYTLITVQSCPSQT